MNYRAYTYGLITTFLVGSIPFMLFYGFLLGSKEHLTVSQVVDAQSEKGGLYGTAIHNTEHAFKLEILKRTKPKVVAVGSSRVLQFRGELFNEPFANLGRTLLSARLASETFQQIINAHKPELIIVGVDFWWFSDNYAPPDRGPLEKGGWVEPSNVMKVLGWIKAGKLPAKQFFDALVRPANDMGALAIINKDGFDRFGARVRTSLVTGKTPSHDRQFNLSRVSMETGYGNFPHAPKLDEAAWNSLLEAIQILKNHQIEAIIVLPPIAARILDQMARTPGLQYAARIRTRLKSLTVPHFDFSDVRPLDSSDCEFYDGVHGGTVTFARMLRQMAKNHQTLAKMINIESIDRTIETSAGRASSKDIDGIKNEVDFLALGCSKD